VPRNISSKSPALNELGFFAFGAPDSTLPGERMKKPAAVQENFLRYDR